MHLAVRSFNSREESSKLRRRLQLHDSRVMVQRCWQDQIHLFFLFAVTAGTGSPPPQRRQDMYRVRTSLATNQGNTTNMHDAVARDTARSVAEFTSHVPNNPNDVRNVEEQNINQRLSSLTIALGSKTHTPLMRDDRNIFPLSWMLSDENANIIMRVMASFGMLPMRHSCASGEPSRTVALAMRRPRPLQTRALLSMGISGRRPGW